MENNTITLADLMNPTLPENSTVLNDQNGIFTVEYTENGCCLHINTQENCTPYIMSAIANYAQNHSDFNTNLVTLSEPNIDEVDRNEVDRFDFDQNYTLSKTDSGYMIFNTSENKAYTFSFLNDAGEQVDVMEMKQCRKLEDCVYAFSLDEKSDDMKIGLVDIQTGTVIEPMFSDIWKVRDYEYVGPAVDDYGIFSSFFKIRTFKGLVIEKVDFSGWTSSERLDYTWFIYEKLEQNDFFEDGAYYSNSRKIIYKISQNNYWLEELIIDFNNVFDSKGKIDIYCRNGNLIRRNGHYFLKGEEIYRLQKVGTEKDLFTCYNNNTNKLALMNTNRRLTGYDFTSIQCIKDNYFRVGLYGKFGVLRYNSDTRNYTILLPIDFQRIDYFDKKGAVRITDYTEESKSIKADGGFIAKKMGMSAWFSLEGIQKTPFVRKECIKFIPSDDDLGNDCGNPSD